MSVYVYVHPCVCVSKYIHVCVYEHVFGCGCVPVWACAYVCTCMCVRVSTNITDLEIPHQLNHLVLIGCYDPGQTAGQQHANQLTKRQTDNISVISYNFS